MPLAPGTRLGSYEIVTSIGAGGMGEVYLARDARLDREVAIKVLPDALASDPERIARLRREARVAASLNHPNIAAIHGSSAFVAAPPVPLFDLPADIVLEGMYSDGERFIARRRLPPRFKGDRIEAIVNWLDQVKAKVPSGT